ncbi:MAG: nucleotidyltransferase family protein [Hydrogenophaga sp.]|uniref:N-acetylmuramate alpha-1-phosphate uridylyltransferase MurU n=1 Tax=Hydrogenophaga sp. TaxID=1904254 RepID=UPI001D55CF11|nr:nucleotidyltransferase family protein [Hydrogenophaga sp.]MBX3611878.1 nucleotidyltransferase family protein [Hydrogenophaga sp.]
MASPAQAIILAAGRGQRMRPLTDHTPKPLLKVRGRPLLQWHVDALSAAGVNRLVINTAWLGEQIPAHFGHPAQASDGESVDVTFSAEGEDFGYALETAGGISRALPLLEEVFWVVAGDVYAPDFPFDAAAYARFVQSEHLAHLWLVPNPPHNPKGDFGLGTDGLAINGGTERLTYSTIGLYRRELFLAPWCDILPGNPQGTAAPLAPLLRQAMDAGRVSAERYDGTWIDVGTPQRLDELNR